MVRCGEAFRLVDNQRRRRRHRKQIRQARQKSRLALLPVRQIAVSPAQRQNRGGKVAWEIYYPKRGQPARVKIVAAWGKVHIVPGVSIIPNWRQSLAGPDFSGPRFAFPICCPAAMQLKAHLV
jgi:hypothetical protein